jgi:glycosyltransferase involved in cell wall biosynthesis
MTGRLLIRFRHNLYPVGRDPLTRLIYAIPEKIIAISDAIRKSLVERGINGNKIRVIHSSVDPGKFNMDARDLRSELGFPDGALIIGNTSTFTRVKGQEYLLEAFNAIYEKHECYLLLAGKIAEEKKGKYLKHVDRGIREHVILLGHRDDIPSVLKTIDIFVYPSILEGLGTSLLEAMMMGRPVAVSDIATFRDFIDDGDNGIFFKQGDPRDIASKVMSLIEQKDLMNMIGRNARNTAMKLFSAAAMVDKTEKLYAELTGQGSHSA